MFSSCKGAKIKALFDGNTSGYKSHSEADMTLIAYLSYWTNGNVRLIDEIFRHSRLMRDKWDRPADDNMTYGARTIAKVLHKNPVNLIPPTAINRTDNLDESEKSTPLAQVNQEEKFVKSVSWYLGNKLIDDITGFKRFKSIKTGYSNLDKNVSLYPGLYVLGAASSTGKTTFLHQRADQISSADNHVIYFSFEVSEFFWVSKGLARLTAQEDLKHAVSAIEIRDGNLSSIVQKAIDKYKSLSRHEVIIKCRFDMTLKEIIQVISTQIQEIGVNPVIVINYLQLISPSDNHMTAKDSVDYNMKQLKDFQESNELIVFVISSVNRQSYLMPADLDFTKESGSIEYTANTVWALEPSIMSAMEFELEKNLQRKRELLKAAKRECPRKLQLVCLKDRDCGALDTYQFNYYAKFDLFVPDESIKTATLAMKPNQIRI